MLHHSLAAGNHTGHTISVYIYRPPSCGAERKIAPQRRGVVAPLGPLLLVVSIWIQRSCHLQIKSGINPAGQQQRNMKPITHLEVLRKLNLISRPICNLMEDGEGPDVERKQLANRALRLRQADGLRDQ